MLRRGVPEPSRRERLIFWSALGALWCFFLLIVHWSPVMLDDWYQVVYWQRHPFSLSAIWQNAVYNYNNYNPRLGENILLIVNGPRWIYLLATPTLEIGFLLVTYAVVFGHWARRGLVIQPRLRGLDTGCVYGGRLTAWIVEENRLVQVPGWDGH